MSALKNSAKYLAVFVLGIGIAANGCSPDNPQPEGETRVVERTVEVEVPVVRHIERVPDGCRQLLNDAWTVMSLASDLSATQGEQTEISNEMRQAIAEEDLIRIGSIGGRQTDLIREQFSVYQSLAGLELTMAELDCDLGD